MPAASGFGSKRNRMRDRVAYVRTDCNFTPDMTVTKKYFSNTIKDKHQRYNLYDGVHDIKLVNFL